MAFTSGAVAIGTGIAAGVGATAAAIRAAKMRANPRQTQYGGGVDEQAALQAQNASGVAQGNRAYTGGVLGLQGSQAAAGALGAQGQQLVQSAGSGPSTYAPSAGGAILGGYVPGQVAATQQQQALDQGAQQNLGAARSGGALGMRNALVANAGSTVQAAGQAAAQRAQEQQAYVQAQVEQANGQQQTRMQANQFDRTLGLQQAQVGLGAQQGAITAGTSAAGAMGELGIANQSAYLNQQQHVNDEQNANNIQYDVRRQQEQQRRSNAMWGFAGGLLGVAGSAASGAKFGGGGGVKAGGDVGQFGDGNNGLGVTWAGG